MSLGTFTYSSSAALRLPLCSSQSSFCVVLLFCQSLVINVHIEYCSALTRMSEVLASEVQEEAGLPLFSARAITQIDASTA